MRSRGDAKTAWSGYEFSALALGALAQNSRLIQILVPIDGVRCEDREFPPNWCSLPPILRHQTIGRDPNLRLTGTSADLIKAVQERATRSAHPRA